MRKLIRRVRNKLRPADSADPVDLLDGRPWQRDVSDEEKDILRFAKPYTMTSQARLVYLVRAVRYLVENRIPGSIIECGVWRGGSMMAVARTLVELKAADRDLYLFDTYAGMNAPTEHDRKAEDDLDVRQKWQQSQRGDVNEWCYASIEDVRSNLLSTGYPEEKLHFIKGPVEETLAEFSVEQIALLRLDTDWYVSTKCELETLYSSVAPSGVVILDDYGSWDGARKAVDEFLPTLPYPVLLHRVDPSARAWVVPVAAVSAD